MTAPLSPPPRRFLAPFIGTAFVFAALGPPIGLATFVPLALLLKAPAAGAAFAFTTLAGALFGHWLLLLPAYAIGLGPAVATGVLYALWDATAPERWPRALAGAVIGGLVAYAVALILRAKGTLLSKRFAWTCLALFAAALLSLGPVDSSRHPASDAVRTVRS